jgi:hypothetical protein
MSVAKPCVMDVLTISNLIATSRCCFCVPRRRPATQFRACEIPVLPLESCRIAARPPGQVQVRQAPLGSILGKLQGSSKHSHADADPEIPLLRQGKAEFASLK